MQKKINQIVILDGGKATRLGILVKNKPKILLKFNKKTLLEILIKNFSKYKIFKEVLVLTSLKYKKKFKKFNNKIHFGMKIKVNFSKNYQGTLGALHSAKNRLNNFFLLCNGDKVFDLNYKYLINNFDFKKKILISKVRIGKKYLNSGYYIVAKKILNKFSFFSSLEFYIFNKLNKKEKKEIFFDNHLKNFTDIRTVKDYKFFKKNSKLLFTKKTIFLDRDGVINIDKGYIDNKKNIEFTKGFFKAIEYLVKNNYRIIIVTNQSGIGRGLISVQQFHRIMDYIFQEVENNKGIIDDYYFAPYYQYSKNKLFLSNKYLRKPDNGMFIESRKKWFIDLNRSFMVGDKLTDRTFAKKSNLRFILFKKNDNLFRLLKSHNLFCK